jgi:hypothetical protein
MIQPEQMDATWFTELFAARDSGGARVTEVSRTQIGTGQIGKCYRFALTVEGDTGNVPSSLVGKFPSDNELSRATGVQLRNYYREVMFYQHFADRVSIAIPNWYYADIEGEGPEFILLLEDMTPAEPGDQLTGCSAAVARAAVLELVGLQAPTWCDQRLYDYDWLASPDTSDSDLSALYRQMVPSFLERYGAKLSEDERDIIARVGESPGCPLFQRVQAPFCLEHVDYRLDNMLIDSTSTPPRITVVDWQSVRVGKPMNDVAYFLGAGMLPESRREVEEDIVRAYHDKLMAAGIDGYSWQTCWQDYRRGTFSGFGVTVIASMIVEETQRGNEMFTTMARRHARHALDHHAGEFL